MEPEEEKDKLEIVENKLRELRAQIEKIEEQNKALFEELGLGPHQVQDILSNPANFSKEQFNEIQKERHELETLIERRLSEAQGHTKRELPPDSIRGHWIFVR